MAKEIIVITRKQDDDNAIFFCTDEMLISYCPTIVSVDKNVILTNDDEYNFSSKN